MALVLSATPTPLTVQAEAEIAPPGTSSDQCIQFLLSHPFTPLDHRARVKPGKGSDEDERQDRGNLEQLLVACGFPITVGAIPPPRQDGQP